MKSNSTFWVLPTFPTSLSARQALYASFRKNVRWGLAVSLYAVLYTGRRFPHWMVWWEHLLFCELSLTLPLTNIVSVLSLSSLAPRIHLQPLNSWLKDVLTPGTRLIHFRIPVLAQCPIYQRYSTNVCWMNNPMCFLSALAAKKLKAKSSHQV